MELRTRLRKKKRHLRTIEPDIAVIQECSQRSAKSLPPDGYAAEWIGSNPNIGMGIFYEQSNWRVRRMDSTDDIRWVVPFEISGPESFTLIAVWACQVKGHKRESYVGQINRALAEHPDWFRNGPVVVAGDFNSNARWDAERPNWNHSTLVAALHDNGLVSLYHSLKNE